MSENVRSTYIRVLRGRFDYNSRTSWSWAVDTGAGRVSSRELKRLRKARRLVKLRNIKKELEWFKKFKEFKYNVYNDYDAPEEILAALSGYNSKIPRYYAWLEKYLVEDEKKEKLEEGG